MKYLATTIFTVLFLTMMVISMVSGLSLHRYNNSNNSTSAALTTKKHPKYKHRTKVLFHSHDKSRLTTKTKSITSSTSTLVVVKLPSPLSVTITTTSVKLRSSTITSKSTKTTTTTVKPSKTTTTKKQQATATTTSSSIPAPTSSPISGGGGNSTTKETYTGDGTWFNTGLGSCGWTNSDSEYIAALDAPLMNNPANPNKNPLCGKMIKVTNQANNKSVTVKIVDTCPPCLEGSVDLSPSAFSQIADLDTGRIKIGWHYVDV